MGRGQDGASVRRDCPSFSAAPLRPPPSSTPAPLWRGCPRSGDRRPRIALAPPQASSPRSSPSTPRSCRPTGVASRTGTGLRHDGRGDWLRRRLVWLTRTAGAGGAWSRGRPGRHQNLWWLRESGVWLILHEGEPWAWRRFQDWGGDGLFHPGTGTEIVYSPDLSRAAVITPGEGAVVYDARSGAELGRIPESAMPARRRPRALKSLSLP